MVTELMMRDECHDTYKEQWHTTMNKGALSNHLVGIAQWFTLKRMVP